MIDKTDPHIFSDVRALSSAAATRWVELSKLAISDHGQFHVALSGGSTPKLLYDQLISPQVSSLIDWSNVQIYFGDERNVPEKHPDSNYRMANEALLSKVPIPRDQIHRIEIDINEPERTADAYSDCLIKYLPKDTRAHLCFDLVLLGLGTDGHIASLFPDTDILNEYQKMVVAVFVKKLKTWRISISFSIINHAAHIMLLVAGSNKADIIEYIMSENTHTPLLPVEMIQAVGTMEWYLDQPAALKLR